MSSAAATSLHPSFWRASFEQHGGVILAFLSSRVGRRDLAEDLLQETFVRAMRSESLRDVSKVRSYLLSIAHRLVIDHVRKKRPVLFTEMASEEDVAHFSDSLERAPDERAEQGLMESRLADVVASLSEPLRVAFTSAVIEQRSYAEIATAEGWSEGRVRVNVHRARKQVVGQMRELLQLDPGDEP